MNYNFIMGYHASPIGQVPVVSVVWSSLDRWQTIKVRWGVERMQYAIQPGVYCVGNPNENSHVFVTANYKLSFDHLRRSLAGINAWILVINTKGINVWCAAGKGTFGTKELVSRIREHEIDKIVLHRKLILPQLGATGVSAHQVKDETGFRVIYGPVKAADIKEFLALDMKATEAMRTITFPIKERLKLIPVDVFYAKYYLILVPAVFFLISGLYRWGYSIDKAFFNGGKSVINLLSAYLTGIALTPALLPWIPFRRFSNKGMLLGWMTALFLLWARSLGSNPIEIVSWFLMMGGISSFMAMNFTGSSTFTSLSGVQKEMKTAIPIQISMVSLGLLGWIIIQFFNS